MTNNRTKQECYECAITTPDQNESNVFILSVAPSPPRSVRARLVSAQQSLVEVSWREPVASNGIITQYTLSVTSSVSTSNGNGGITVTQVEVFNKASAKTCASRNTNFANTI